MQTTAVCFRIIENIMAWRAKPNGQENYSQNQNSLCSKLAKAQYRKTVRISNIKLSLLSCSSSLFWTHHFIIIICYTSSFPFQKPWRTEQKKKHKLIWYGEEMLKLFFSFSFSFLTGNKRWREEERKQNTKDYDNDLMLVLLLSREGEGNAVMVSS